MPTHPDDPRPADGRFSRGAEPGRHTPGDAGSVATRTPGRMHEEAPEAVRREDGPSTIEPATAAAVRSRQRAEFGGLHWGAAFFGWLVAFGMAALLSGLLAAAGAAIGYGEIEGTDTETIGLAGGILLLAVAMLAYYAGGYVAGRLSRFDGSRQGAGVWVLGLLVTAALAAAAVIGGEDYNVVDRAGLPRFTVGEEEATTAGLIAMAAILIGTFVAAVVGGKAGERYHRRIDRLAIGD